MVSALFSVNFLGQPEQSQSMVNKGFYVAVQLLAQRKIDMVLEHKPGASMEPTKLIGVRNSSICDIGYSPGQAKGFSPVCVRMWVIRVDLCENREVHNVQACGFSPVWVRS